LRLRHAANRKPESLAVPTKIERASSIGCRQLQLVAGSDGSWPSVSPTPAIIVCFLDLGSRCMIREPLVYFASNRFFCGRNIDVDHWEWKRMVQCWRKSKQALGDLSKASHSPQSGVGIQRPLQVFVSARVYHQRDSIRPVEKVSQQNNGSSLQHPAKVKAPKVTLPSRTWPQDVHRKIACSSTIMTIIKQE
jgi:hypothetical protein